MQVFEFFEELEERGLLPGLVSSGVVPLAVVNYYKIAKLYNAKRQKFKKKPLQTLKIQVAEELGAGRTTVYKAINIMSRPASGPSAF